MGVRADQSKTASVPKSQADGVLSVPARGPSKAASRPPSCEEDRWDVETCLSPQSAFHPGSGYNAGVTGSPSRASRSRCSTERAVDQKCSHIEEHLEDFYRAVDEAVMSTARGESAQSNQTVALYLMQKQMLTRVHLRKATPPLALAELGTSH